MLSAAFRCLALLAAAIAFGPGVAAAASAQLVTLPVPALTIYPGDLIEADALTEHTFILSRIGSGYIDSTDRLIGKVARRTLLPDHPSPPNAIGEVDLVTRGTTVQLVFQQAGLIITAFAAPLQDGSAGEVIRVRNIDSGAVVVGIVQTDGTVRVGAQ